jgi:hypothetical protein
MVGQLVSHSVSMSWCRAPLWAPLPNFTFSFLLQEQLLCSSSWGALPDERTGLHFVVQSVSGQSCGGLITIELSHLKLLGSLSTTRRDYGGSILTRLHTGLFPGIIHLPAFY